MGLGKRGGHGSKKRQTVEGERKGETFRRRLTMPWGIKGVEKEWPKKLTVSWSQPKNPGKKTWT